MHSAKRRKPNELSSPDAYFAVNRDLQTLEALPVEVVPQIFIHCLNPSLPTASLPLCRKLTGLCQLQRSLFLHAFYPSLVSSSTIPSLPRSLNSQHHYSYEAQSQLFRQAWLTYPFTIATLGQNLPHWLRTHTRVHMPSKVLHGPWDEDKLALLSLLLRSHALIETTELETASLSFLSACRDNNLPLLRTLVRKEWCMNTDCTPEISAVAGGDDYFEMACMNIFIAGDRGAELMHIDHKTGEVGKQFSTGCAWVEGVWPETEHLRAAVLDGGAQKETLEVLWSAIEHRMDMWDHDIWDWIREKRLEEDERARWLPEQLETWNKQHPPNVRCDCDHCSTSMRQDVPGLGYSGSGAKHMCKDCFPLPDETDQGS